jgi:hypothetical protein
MIPKPVTPRSWWLTVAAFLMSSVVACAGALLTSAKAAGTSSLGLRAVGTTGTLVAGPDQFAVTGNTTVNISVARLSGGTTRVVAGPDSSLPRAVQFPSYVGSGTYPRAVVRLLQRSGDALSPGSSNFQYGAVFRLNTVSAGRSVDNGNNLFQRGLYADRAQFKLQIDHGYPSCLVKGSAGRVFVRSNVKLAPDTWYRTTCSRVGSRLAVSVTRHGSASTVSRSVGGSSGTLTFASSVRASIGGKLAYSGAVVSSTDQFNGAVARVWVGPAS